MQEGTAAKKILIVDDEERNLKLMGSILSKYDYSYETAKNGKEALEKSVAFLPDLIYLDLMMPEMDGYTVCRHIREDPRTERIPVVMVTVLSDREHRIKALESGANDFLSKPVDPLELMVRTQNLLKIKEFEDFLKRHGELLEEEVKRRTSQLKLALNQLSKSNRELEESKKKIKGGYIDTVQRLTTVAEYKDKDTAQHIKRVSWYCAALAGALGWGEEAIETIFYASPMHDIGKVGIPSEILLKPGALNTEEYALMKTHTNIGARMLQGSASSILKMAETIAKSHHERWDGTGYPTGLKGESIPVEGAIMNLADQYDALRSRRPYKPALTHENVVKIIIEGDGRTLPLHFSPKVLNAFREISHRFDSIFEEFNG